MKDVLKGMNGFSSEICSRMSLWYETYLITCNYFSYFENHWRIFILFIFDHPIERLSDSNINLSAFCQLELVIYILPFFTFELRIRVDIFRLDMTDRIKAKSLEQLILRDIEDSFLFIFISNFLLKLLSTQARFLTKLAIPFKTSPRISYFKYVSVIVLYYW